MPIDPSQLPVEVRARLAEIESLDTLGASRQLALAADLFLSAVEHRTASSSEIIRLLEGLAARMIDARGASSQAIPNGIRSMLAGLVAQESRHPDEVCAWVRLAVGRYAVRQREGAERLAAAGAALLRDAQRVVAYDFSSSVAAVLAALVIDRPTVDIVILEARPLDGGTKYLRGLGATASSLRFLPDSAMIEALAGADAALVGAETLTAGGGCYNTIGTLLLAVAARRDLVPLYVASSTIKIDIETIAREGRPIPIRDLASVLRREAWPTGVVVDTTCPDLDYTPPELITGYITEHGLLEPPALAAQAEALSQLLAGSVT